MEKSEIKAIIENLGLSVSFKFVPFSQSRNKDNKNLSLNYIATIQFKGKDIFSCDYMQGIAHAPSYKQNGMKYEDKERLKFEAEKGKRAGQVSASGQVYIVSPTVNILPDNVDFFYCISSDCDVLNYSSFEDWSENFGYESDSRKAEKIYNECLKQALAMRSAIGEKGLQELQDAFQDY